MEQEQKPFEIKKLFTVGFSAVSLEKMAQDGLGDLFFNNAMVKKLSQGLIEANAEIRRLQAGNKELSQRHESVVKQLMSNIEFHLETIDGLRDEIDGRAADAPSWGESKRAMEICKIDEVRDAGIYEFKHTDGSTSVMSIGLYSNKVFESFRRLNYEPKPAREVEKKYGGDTLRKWAVMEDVPIGQMAKNLIAAQARIKELEGK